ncbi:hypothetical protein BGZ98_004572 [Dissophora globulifera]|nr:hypothetical protein BGZ98_004572 [Dissophora globulifera]
MSSTVMILEIPLILDAVCDYLSPDNIFTCLKVSKLWNSLFIPYQWRTVAVTSPTPHSSGFFGASMQLISKNAHRIRSLSVDNTRILNELFTPAFPASVYLDDFRLPTSTLCRGLTSLSCPMKLMVIDDDDEDSAIWDHPTSLFRLITDNRRLRKLTLQEVQLMNHELYYMLLFVAIAAHPTLSVLSISNSIIFFKGEYTPTLSMFQAPHLKELYLKYARYSSESDIVFTLVKHCPNLRVLQVPEIEADRLGELASLVRESCPQLTDLLIEWPDLSPQDVGDFVIQSIPPSKNSVPCRLRSLTIAGFRDRIQEPDPFGNDGNFHTIPMILDHCGATLERLRLQEGLDIPWNDYVLILTSCPKLRELSHIRDPNERMRFRYGRSNTSIMALVSAPQYYLASELAELTGPSTELLQWVCKDLEILDIIVRDDTDHIQFGHTESDPEPQHDAGSISTEQGGLATTASDTVSTSLLASNTAASTATSISITTPETRTMSLSVPVMLDMLFQRLGQLKKLRELTLGWESPLLIPGQTNFSSSLEAGLKHLDGLHDFRVFRVCDYSVRVSVGEKPMVRDQHSSVLFGQAERDWMTTHWPRFEEFTDTALPLSDDEDEYMFGEESDEDEDEDEDE